MSDDLTKQLATALSRIAALESRQAPAHVAAPQGIDAAQLRRELTNDPIGTLTRLGVPIDHVTRVAVANALGNDAPAELRMLAQMGPQVSAQQALASELAATRQRLEAIEQRDTRSVAKSSFSSLAANKTKYPLLAAAIAKNPTLFDSDVDSHKGDAAALADTIEGRIKSYNDALGITPPASSGNADSAKDQSSQVKQAQPGSVVSGGTVDQTPPTGTSPAKGVFSQAEHDALKDRIIRKYSPS